MGLASFHEKSDPSMTSKTNFLYMLMKLGNIGLRPTFWCSCVDDLWGSYYEGTLFTAGVNVFSEDSFGILLVSIDINLISCFKLDFCSGLDLISKLRGLFGGL